MPLNHLAVSLDPFDIRHVPTRCAKCIQNKLSKIQILFSAKIPSLVRTLLVKQGRAKFELLKILRSQNITKFLKLFPNFCLRLQLLFKSNLHLAT